MELRNRDFIQLVKRTREKFGVSIDEAHDLIFSDSEMRRLVALRINSQSECRRMASQDIAAKGDRSRFVRDGDRIKFRKSNGQR